ncbi:hypothetical protein RchiOBHm_Chr7g0236911 [Rosa chinensis]|uniref:Uncharacterized protein n=1 Tax=Rosa chinensis TaxID=74649 RepID=A0A2P6PH23_ROSCH|nr:hypothetical protein RchiOBHm_Chr7g0236911 [Rosa chinensis]
MDYYTIHPFVFADLLYQLRLSYLALRPQCRPSVPHQRLFNHNHFSFHLIIIFIQIGLSSSRVCGEGMKIARYKYRGKSENCMTIIVISYEDINIFSCKIDLLGLHRNLLGTFRKTQ